MVTSHIPDNCIELLRFTLRHSASVAVTRDQAISFLWRRRELAQKIEHYGDSQESTIFILDALAKHLLGNEYIWPTTKFSPQQAADFYKGFIAAVQASDYELLIPYPDKA